MNEVPKIDSRTDFAEALRWAFARAAARPARTIICVDPGFADWPLDDSELHDTLSAWLRLPQRRLVLLAVDYDEVRRRHPRFTRWRADWGHAIEAFHPPEDLRPDLPSVFVDDFDTVVELKDPVHWHGAAEIDRVAAQAWRERIDAVLQRSEPGFAVTRLGL